MTRPTKNERIKYSVDYSWDTDFSAFARLLQSKWRENKGYNYVKYGNFLDVEFAKSSKANFLTDNIKELVTNAVNNTKISGALISDPRIWNNLLSSQPLCFNLFGELYYDLDLATKFFKVLFPERIDTVTSVKFEYSAGRGNIEYSGDHSAFDVFVEYKKNGKEGFIGIEVKYAESLSEESKQKALETFKKHKTEYHRLTTDKVFKPNAIEFVTQIPISQIWRDHLLSLAHQKDYKEGFFVFLYPKNNSQCQKGVDEYKKYLISENEEQTGFYPRYLDDFIQNLTELSNAKWINELKKRYLGIV